MKVKPTLDEILKKNPSIDKKDVSQARDLTEELRKLGVHRKEYQLATPFSRRRPTLDAADTSDPRTINLTGTRE